MAKYTPKSREELRYLVQDESIYLGDIDTSNIIDMSQLFEQTERRDFSGIDSWDTSNVVDMSFMFAGAKFFNENINSWNTSNVVCMHGMFFGTELFNQPLDKWDTSKVVNMAWMFKDAKSFNQNIDSWNANNVKVNVNFDDDGMFKDSNMENMPIWWSTKNMDWSESEKMTNTIISKSIIKYIEKDARSNKYVPESRKELWALCYDKSISLGDIDTSNIVNMSDLFLRNDRRDFSGIESWDTSKVVDMRNVFRGHESFNEPLDNWDTSSVEFMGSMFLGAESFNQNINSWDVSSVRDNERMFWDSGVSKLPKWYKKRKIDNVDELAEKRVAEVMMNPRPKKPKIPPQNANKANDLSDLKQKDNSPKLSLKNKIAIAFSIFFVMAICFNIFKSMLSDSDTKSQPTQTQQTQSTQTQPQPTKSAQPTANMIRCDDKDLLNHLIKSYKNIFMNQYHKDVFTETQEYYRQHGINLTSIEEYINSQQYNITKTQTNSSDEANREIICEAEVETINTIYETQIYDSVKYRAKLKDDNRIEFEILNIAYIYK